MGKNREKNSRLLMPSSSRQCRADSAMGFQWKESWWEVKGKERRERTEKQKMLTMGILDQVDSRFLFVTDYVTTELRGQSRLE